MTLDQWNTVAEIAESAATVVAFIAAGVWTYRHFVLRRQRFPRAAVSHTSNTFLLADGRTLFRVAARIVNSGEVLLCVNFARTRVQHLFPLPDHIAARLAEARDCDPLAPGEYELPWTVLGAREWRFTAKEAEIEPGESEVLHCDFVIPPGVEQVLLYTYVTNHLKTAHDIGWSDTVVVSLTEGKPMAQPQRDPNWQEKQLPRRPDPDRPSQISPQLPYRPDPPAPPPPKKE